MTTTLERYTVDLLCPQCKQSGVAQLSEEDAPPGSDGATSARIDSLPEGFRQVPDRSAPGGIGVHCAACNVSAWK